MGYDKKKIRQIRWLLVFAAALLLVLIYSGQIFHAAALGFQMIMPFLVGGVIAFVLNLPMNLFEKKIFARWRGKLADRLKRPFSMALSLILVAAVLLLVFFTVVPQLTKTLLLLGNKIPAFVDDAIHWLKKMGEKYPQLREETRKLENVEINWAQIGSSVLGFLRSGFGDVVTSTVNVAASIVGGVTNAMFSLIFSLYVLGQKEKLQRQCRKLLRAYLPEKVSGWVEHVFSLLYQNFSKFITGQCLEAVILGAMFVVAMLLFRMPYAVMIGVLIAFTALIPIVGAFIGCVVGAFLILIESPVQAVVFLILFQVLQQLEGNLIYPKVVGNSVGLPSMWVLVAVSVGGSLFGVAGMLMFIPLAATGYTLLRENVNRRVRS